MTANFSSCARSDSVTTRSCTLRHHVAELEVALQLLDGADAVQVPVVHDRQPIAEELALVHAVRGEHDVLVLALALLDAGPHEATRRRIDAGRRLVEEHDERIGLLNGTGLVNEPFRRETVQYRFQLSSPRYAQSHS